MAGARQVGAEFIEAFNAHDESRLRQLNAVESVIEASGDVRLEGREPATQYAMAWLRAFPDARFTLRNELEAGDWVVQEFTFEGTHGATLATPAGDIPPTNRRLQGRGVQLLHVEGREVTDTRIYFDQVQVMTQLGLMPEASAR